MTLADLKDYKIVTRKTVSTTYRNYTLFSTSAPSSGSVALSILKLVENYDLSDASLRPLNTHRLDEAMRWSYAARGQLGDPDFFPFMAAYEDEMLTPSTIASIRKRIRDSHTHDPTTYHLPNQNNTIYYQPTNHGTSHIVASDSSGLSITLTSTVNLLFGSHLMVPETGVIMNNEMDDFSIPGRPNAFGFPPSPFNFPGPNKRPLSSITPVHVVHPNGSLYISIGAAGGSRIPTSTVLSIVGVLDYGLSLPEALAEPRFHDQLFPATTTFEENFQERLVKAMGEKGHNVTWVGRHLSAVQGVRRFWNGTFEAAGEPRQVNSGGLSC